MITTRDDAEDDELIYRAMRIYARRARDEGWRHEPAVPTLCGVERYGGKRPLISVRNVYGVLARYSYNDKRDRLSWVELPQ
jgi:hypothetical protein